MAKKTKNNHRLETTKHFRTSIGNSAHSRPKNKNTRRLRKAKYRGQGK